MNFNLSDATDFVLYENYLLDNCNYNDWYDLFSDDGVYWVPGSSDQKNTLDSISIALENKLLLKLRIERLSHKRSFSLQPTVKGIRVVQPPRLRSTELNEEGCLVVETNIIYSEFQSSQVEQHPAKVVYHLKPKGDSWEIFIKKIKLLAVDGYLPSIQLFV